MGEPYPSQAEMAGFGRILFHARQYWPDYISCVLVVREDVIEKKPEAVQVLVDGIARSGLWRFRGSVGAQADACRAGGFIKYARPCDVCHVLAVGLLGST